MTPDKFVCGSGGWCLSPAAFAFKTPRLPLTTNLGKHDFIIIQTKTSVPAGVVTITISGLTMGAITQRKEDGFKVSQDETAIESAFVPAVALTSQLFAGTTMQSFNDADTLIKKSFNIYFDNHAQPSAGLPRLSPSSSSMRTLASRAAVPTSSGYPPLSSSAAPWVCWPSAQSTPHASPTAFL